MNRKKISDYDASRVKSKHTYVVEEEKVETKIREEAMLPKRYPSKTLQCNIGTDRFYIVKKKPDGTIIRLHVFCLYNWDTRNLMFFAHLDKDYVP